MTTPQIESLRIEYLRNPLGIDERAPRLSWRLASERRGARQTAYRIRVATSPQRLAAGDADLWDTGRVASDESAHIVYGGKPLAARMACWWQVEVWDETGARIVSDNAFWTMGLLDRADWSARWIAADPAAIARDPEAVTPTLVDCGTPTCFRKEFEVGPQLVSATLYISARGLVEARLTGRRVGEDLFAPEWTDYDKRIHYRTYDVTELVEEGPAALAVVLGDGWWSGYVGWQETRARYGSLENSFLAQLELLYADGRRETVSSDASWSCDTGPILSSDFMMGEVYDARREQTGWDRPGFTMGRWLASREVQAPSASLVAQRSEPVRIVETLAPRSMVRGVAGGWILDLGQNIAGWPRLRVKAPAGTAIQLRFAERLKPDGSLYTDNLRRAKATDTYICRGDGEVETWEPRFTFHGFQYIEVNGLPGDLEADTVVGCVAQSATPPAGAFECSNADVNRLWLNGLWSQRDNFLSVPTDCPQRDERLGWMGDAQVFLRTASYNMDVAAFFTKWMIDVEDAQTEDGLFPDTAPRLREGENFVGLDDLVGGAGWADAGIIIPHTIWRVYGDTRIIERHWDAMVAWLDYLERTNPAYLRVNDLRNNYGDWLCIPSDREFRTHSPMKDLLATAFWADGAAKLGEMARAIGRVAAAERFEAQFRTVREAFQSAYVRPDGSLTVETQTAYLLALALNLMPDSLRPAAAERLVEAIRDRDWHLSAGFIGIRFLNPTLTLAGRNDVAYRLLLQETYPSWLYPVKHGATTIWERWNGWTEAEGFFDPLMNSFNHYSLGSVGEWLYRHVAGIELDSARGGYKRFTLRPFPGPGLDHARASYDSLYGPIVSAWRWEGDRFVWSVRVPANTSARAYLPVEQGEDAAIDGLPLAAGSMGGNDWTREGDRLVIELPAGAYRFESDCPRLASSLREARASWASNS